MQANVNRWNSLKSVLFLRLTKEIFSFKMQLSGELEEPKMGIEKKHFHDIQMEPKQ